jgi:hypothetical protein
MRAAVQRNDARVVEIFLADDDVRVRLDDLDENLSELPYRGAPPSLRQRSEVLNAAALAPWRLTSAREASFAARALVGGGIRPSAGSTTSDVGMRPATTASSPRSPAQNSFTEGPFRVARAGEVSRLSAASRLA